MEKMLWRKKTDCYKRQCSKQPSSKGRKAV